MPEPVSTGTAASLIVGTGLGLASLLPGVDPNALIGAFAGAALFALRERQTTIVARVLYYAVSVVLGYLAAPEVGRWLPVQAAGLQAAIASASVVVVANRWLDWLNATGLADLWSRIRGGGPR